MNNKCKQVKEVGINPDFEAAQAGNPLCHACGAEEGKKPRGRPVKIGVEKHIRITDVSMTEMINALVNHPDGGNFNQVINEALFYGLPILYEKLYGGTVTEEEKISLTNPFSRRFSISFARSVRTNATSSKSLIRDFSRTRPNTSLALRRKGSRNSGGKENQQPTDHFQYSVYAVSSAENSDERGA